MLESGPTTHALIEVLADLTKTRKAIFYCKQCEFLFAHALPILVEHLALPEKGADPRDVPDLALACATVQKFEEFNCDAGCLVALVQYLKHSSEVLLEAFPSLEDLVEHKLAHHLQINLDVLIVVLGTSLLHGVVVGELRPNQRLDLVSKFVSHFSTHELFHDLEEVNFEFEEGGVGVVL